MQNKAKKKAAGLRLKREVQHSEYDEERKQLIKSVGTFKEKSYLELKGHCAQINDLAFKGYSELFSFNILFQNVAHVQFTADQKIVFQMKEHQELIKVALQNPLTFHKPSPEKLDLEINLLCAGVTLQDHYVPRSKRRNKKLVKRKAHGLTAHQIDQLETPAPVPLPLPELQEEVSSSGDEEKKSDISSFKANELKCAAQEIVLLDSETEQECEARKQTPPEDTSGCQTTGVSNLSRIEEVKEKVIACPDSFLSAVLSDQPTFLPKKIEFEYRNQRAQISSHEMLKLLPQQYLNDNIIMSFIYLIMRHLSATDIADRTFIFDNYFVDKLANEDDDPTQVFLEARKYSKRCPDLFEKDFWVIPACRLHHWIAYIVAYPGTAFNFEEEEETPRYSQRPCIMALDSLPARFEDGLPLSSQYKLSKDIRMFMEMEYKFRKCQINDQSTDQEILKAYELSQVHLNDLDVPFNPIRVPRQTNSYDCGIYLLQYIQLFLYEPHFIFEQDEGTLSCQWFSQEMIENKRQEMAVLFYEFAHDRDPIPDYSAYREELFKSFYKQPVSQDYSFRQEDYLLDEELLPHSEEQLNNHQSAQSVASSQSSSQQCSSPSLMLLEEKQNGHGPPSF